MVKSYERYEQEACFGVVAGQSNTLWLPPTAAQSAKSIGRAVLGGLEEILVWDIKTGDLMTRLKEGLTPGASNAPTSSAPSAVKVLAYHRDTEILAAGHSDGTIKVWDLTSGAVVVSFSGHKSAVSVLKFDRTGTRLVSGSADSLVIMWDLVGEEGLFKLKGHKAQITGIEFVSESGTLKMEDEFEDYVITVAKDGLIKLWDLESKQCVETHLAHPSECWALGLSTNRDMLVTCGQKDQVKIWELQFGDGDKIAERGEFEKLSKARCSDVQFALVKDSHATHEVFYLQNVDRTVELFRVRAPKEREKGMAKRVKRLTEKGLSKDEIAESLRELQVSMLITPLSTIRTSSKINSCVWVKKLEFLVSLGNNSVEYHTIPVPVSLRKAQIGDLTSTKSNTIDLLGHRTDIRAMDVSDDDRLLATASNGELKIWNLKTKNVIRTFALDSGYALCCRFLPGGGLVVVGFKNGTLELYDLSSSSLVDRVENAHENKGAAERGAAVWSMDLTPDGKTLVTGGNDKCVKFWKFAVKQEEVPGSSATVSTLKLTHTQTLEVPEDVLCVRVSSDAKYLAVSLLNNNVQVVYLDLLKLYLTLYGHKLPVLSIDISSDSKLIITSSADKNIKIWGMDFGDCHRSLFGHQDSIMCVRFLPESHSFFSCGKDGMVKYWDGDKFQCIQKLSAHQSEVWTLAVSGDGTFVVSTAHDHLIRVWLASNDQVFLEEEREKEIDELYENDLLEAPPEEKPEDDEVVDVRQPTMELLKAGEKLIEALDIGAADLDAVEAYELQMQQHKAGKGPVPLRPTPHAILSAYGISGQEHVLQTVLKIRAAQLEDALLVLPFSYTVRMFRFIELWTNEANIMGNLVYLGTICKILFFMVKVNSKELMSQRDSRLRRHLILVKEQLRTQLRRAARQLGYNTLGLKYKRHEWRLEHETEFIDEAEQREHEAKRAPKRTFVTV